MTGIAPGAHFDFDRIDLWGPELTLVLDGLVPSDVRQTVARSAPEYIEDARDRLFGLSDQHAITSAIAAWLRERPVAGYHGSRLTPEELAGIERDGLRPLRVEDRRSRLVRALGGHAEWPQLRQQLDEALALHGAGERSGRREGQVHLTVSKAGLVRSFNHYLTHGAEVDQHIAQYLLGEAGVALLAQDGEPTLIRFFVPGAIALDACNPYASLSDSINLVADIIPEWAYWLAAPIRASECIYADCGMMFRSSVPAAWIASHEIVPASDLSPD